MLQRRPKTGEAGKKKTKKQKQNKISLSGCRMEVYPSGYGHDR